GWAWSERERRGDRGDSGLEGLVDRAALERVERRRREGDPLRRAYAPPPVDRLAEPVQDPAEHAGADVDAEGAAEGLGRAPRMDAVEAAQRHEQDPALVKADDLGQ